MGPARVARLTSSAGLDALPADARVLVLGSGEHVWDPFLFAEGVAETHPNTRFVATTRSPILVGDTIRSKIEFADHYGMGLAMYLHNVNPSDWDAIVLFNETGADGIPDTLVNALGSVAVIDQDEQVVRLSANSKVSA